MPASSPLIDFSCQDKTTQLPRAKRVKMASERIVIVGVGALGTRVAELLVRAGARQLILIDDDTVEASNLPRQTLFTESDVGKKKAVVAAERLRAIDGKASVTVEAVRLDAKNAERLLRGAAIVMDCVD